MSDLDITDAVLAELRAAADIVEVIGEHTRLKKAGRSWKGLCPFHKERTASFTVDRDKGLYHCFGCGAGGDVIHFVRQMDRLDFPEAVESLAARFGVAIPRRTSRGPRDDHRDTLLEALAAAQRFYAAELGKPGSRAATYLKERGVPEGLSHRLGLGHAPDSWDSLSRALSPAFPESLLIEAGLLQPRPEAKGSYDRFRDRLIFVVRDDRGRPVGFGGRALSPGGEPKYLNSPESPLFVKKRLLYGLSEAREAIRRRERVVLVEGYFDHLALLSADLEETVASMGTALTPEQTEKLRRLSPRVTLCYDGDAAGRAATRGALALLLSSGFEARVARLPDGLDPHDVLREEGVSRLSARIEEAPDYLTWLLEDVKPEQQGISSKQKSERIGSILEIVRGIPDTIRRHEECRRIARHVAVPVELLWERVARGPSRPDDPGGLRPPGTPPPLAVLSDGGIPDGERALLALLIRGGELIPLILGTLKDEWLTHGGVRKVVAAFRTADCPAEGIDFHKQIAHLREDNDIQLLARAAAEDGPEPSQKRALQVLNALEEGYLARRGRTLQDEIQRAESEKRPQEEIDKLIRDKLEIGRRIVELKPSRKGKELGD
ncbi:MAG TPA: DNA primase [Thermoanaerobaculia bacterium]|nr:DNA primase [Thermoanaerobaculia bacterium]